MSIINYWKQFENSGKIEDYLSYRSSCQEADEQLRSSAEGKAEQLGVNPYAGIHMCNRNDTETDAYRGI